MNVTYSVECVYGNNVFHYADDDKPKVGNTITFDDVDYRIIQCKRVVSVENQISSLHYCVCSIEPIENNMVGVVQVKLIQGNNYADMESNLNKFLYENRHNYEILSIDHTMAYVAVKYRMRNKGDKWVSIETEKSYQSK